jgi:CrcB protein
MLSTITSLASIAAGGALGALSRHGVNVAATSIAGIAFPWGTMIVNIVGSFLMGVIIVSFGQIWQPPEPLRLLIVTGFLGAFTTFSTFSLDTVALWERGEMLSAGLYAGLSVVLSIAGLFAGMYLIRSILS